MHDFFRVVVIACNSESALINRVIEHIVERHLRPRFIFPNPFNDVTVIVHIAVFYFNDVTNAQMLHSSSFFVIFAIITIFAK